MYVYISLFVWYGNRIEISYIRWGTLCSSPEFRRLKIMWCLSSHLVPCSWAYLKWSYFPPFSSRVVGELNKFARSLLKGTLLMSHGVFKFLLLF